MKNQNPPKLKFRRYILFLVLGGIVHQTKAQENSFETQILFSRGSYVFTYESETNHTNALNNLIKTLQQHQQDTLLTLKK